MLTATKRVIRSFFILVIGIIAMTCGETPDVISNGQPGPGTPPMTEISDEDRLKVLDEAGKFVDLLGGLKSDVAQQALVQWLQMRPEFKEAGISDRNVWANFHDGRMAMFVPNWLGDMVEGGRMATPEGDDVTNTKPSAKGRLQGLPKSNTVTLFSGLGKAFTEDRQFLKGLFTKSNTSYTVDIKDASIENLKAVKDLGIFYISTHGGTGLVKSEKEAIGAFSLWTKSPVNTISERTYEADLDQRRLVYMNADYDEIGKSELFYAITQEFVAEYMTFAENALLYINACNGSSSDASDFQEAMMSKAGNGKATYIGWTDVTSGTAAKPPARFIFDRLLGAHADQDHTKDPPQRPFDIENVFQELYHLGMGESSLGGTLTFSTNVEPEAILTPSIEYMTIQDYDSKLFIKGYFGDEPGIVTVDGVAVPAQWSDAVLVCQLPDTGPGSSGEVIVSVRGNKSNPVPLSEWNIPLTVSLDQLGLTTEATVYLRIRGDVHSYRPLAIDGPTRPVGDIFMLQYDNALGWSFAKGTAGTYSVGGQSNVTCPLGACKTTEKQTIVQKGGKLPYLTTTSGMGFSAYYKWSENRKSIIVALDVNVTDVGVEYESTMTCPGVPPTTVGRSFATPMGIHNLLDPLSRLEFTLDDNFTIVPGNRSRYLGEAPAGCTGTVQMEFNAQWSTSPAAFAPNKDTEARIGL